MSAAMQATIRINEIFASIQGESTFAGRPCVFVRVSGCPLRCAWCDTQYAYDEGQELTLPEIVAQATAYDIRLVEITGGEPLAQEAVLPLIAQLCDRRRRVLVETSGAIDIAPVDRRAHIIMDIKCPSSGMAARTRWDNIPLLRRKDEVKLVVADRTDYEYARRVIREQRLAKRCTVLLSAVYGQVDPQEVVAWMLADGLPARFQLQLHKQIWGPDRRGV